MQPIATGAQNTGMRPHHRPPDALRRSCLLAVLPWLSRAVAVADASLRDAMRCAVAIRDAARRLRTKDLSGCVLVATSRPCHMCEAAAGWAGISGMVYGDSLTDASAPR